MDEKEAEASPIMGTIFLVYVCLYVSDCLWVNNTKKNHMLKCMGGMT